MTLVPVPNLRMRLRRLFLAAMLAVLGSGVIAFSLDYAVFRIRAATDRNAYGTVRVNHYYAVLQKNGKTQFIFDPPQDQTCVHSTVSARRIVAMLVPHSTSRSEDRYLETRMTR